jgi:hypothetical protein
MKKRIILSESDLVKLVRNVISEQRQYLSRLFGNSVDDIIKMFGDDAAKSLDDVFAKLYSKQGNLVNTSKGLSIKSASGSEIPVEDVKDIISLVGQGKLQADEVLKYFPRYLADGTEFRSVLQQAMLKKGGQKISQVVSNLQLGKVAQDFKNFHAQSKWVQVTQPKGNMSGWKFHVYADNLDEVAYLYERLLPLVNKYGAGLKLAGGKELEILSQIPLQKGKGVTIYLRSKTFADDMVDNFVSDLQSAISGYTKKGNINGDRMITNNIGYRYELSRPINIKIGVDDSQYRALYSSNQGGPHNIPNNPDLFR